MLRMTWNSVREHTLGQWWRWWDLKGPVLEQVGYRRRLGLITRWEMLRMTWKSIREDTWRQGRQWRARNGPSLEQVGHRRRLGLITRSGMLERLDTWYGRILWHSEDNDEIGMVQLLNKSVTSVVLGSYLCSEMLELPETRFGKILFGIINMRGIHCSSECGFGTQTCKIL